MTSDSSHTLVIARSSRRVRSVACLFGFLTIALCVPPANAQRTELRNPAVIARSLLANHFVDSALKLVDAGLATDSNSAALWNVKARILSARGDRAGQESALRRVLRISPDFQEAHEQLAAIYCDSGMTDSAAKYLALPMRVDSINPRVIYYAGKIQEQLGHLDTAVARYSQCYGILSATDFLRLPVSPGYRIPSTRLRTTGADDIQLPANNPTLLLFWATWSPSSMKAITAMTAKLATAGITWKFLPVNVDSREWLPSSNSLAEAKVRDQGYKGPVPVDSGLLFFDQLGLSEVPSLVVTNLSADVDEVLSGWSKRTANHVTRELLAKADSTMRRTMRKRSACDNTMRRLGTAWLNWERFNPLGALAEISRVTRSCSTSAYPYALSAAWRWSAEDTLRAAGDAYHACRADSTSPLGWLAVAELERRRNHRDASAEALRRAMARDSGLVAGWNIAGRLAAERGDTVALRRSIGALDRLNRTDPGGAVLRALLFQSQSNWAEAAKAWRALLAARI